MKEKEIAEKTPEFEKILKESERLPDMVWIPDYVSITGSTVYGRDRKPNDMDVVIRSNEMPEPALTLKLERVFRGIFDREIHWVPNAYGPNWMSLPIYDLVLRKKREFKLREMGEPEFAEMLYKSIEKAELPAEAKREAEESKKEGKIKMFRFFYPFKTSLDAISAYRVGEKYSVGDVIEYFRQLAEKFKVDFVRSCAQKKYDGARQLIYKSKDKVRIITEGGNDVTDRLPETVKELKAIEHPEEFILDSEFERWDGKTHLPREEVAGYLHGKGEPDDSDIIANCFDCLYFYDSEMTHHQLGMKMGDIHDLPQETRLKYLDLIPFPQSTIEEPDLKHRLNKTPTFYIEKEKDFEPVLTKLSESPFSEGAMIKFLGPNSEYPLTGSGTQWLKFKRFSEVHAVVWKKNITKVPTIFNYEVALSFTPADNIDPDSIVKIKDREYTKIGRTYNTSVEVPIGGIITVKFHTMNYYRDEKGRYRIHLYEPGFYEYRPEQNLPDSFRDAVTIGRDSGLLQEKFEKELTEKIEDVKRYDPSKLSDEVLLDDHRILQAWYATYKAGKETKYSEREILETAMKIIGEMLERKMKFHYEKMKDTSKELLDRTLKEIITKALYLVEPHGELIARGEETLIIQKEYFPALMGIPVFLYSGDRNYGILQITKISRISDKRLKELEDRHKVTSEEKERRWKKFKDFYAYEFIPQVIFDTPKEIKLPKDSQALVIVEKQVDPFMAYPDEEKTLHYVVQMHARGKSSHSDMRLEMNNHLIGWTFFDLVAGSIKKPVETMEEAKQIANNPDNFKIDWTTGEFKKREIRGGVVRKTSIMCSRKKKEPKVWLTVSGIAEPGEVGASKEHRGIFHIVDKGVVEFGSLKPWSKEYFFNGEKLKGKLLFRAMGKTEKRDELKDLETGEVYKAVLPPSEEQELREPFFWLCIQTEDQTPYVLSKEAVSKDWMPPFGISALPRRVRKNIPSNLQYWKEKDRKKASEMRKELVEEFEEIVSTEVRKADSSEFVLQHQWFKGPVVVRFGPSTEWWALRVKNDSKVINFLCQNNPVDNPAGGLGFEEELEDWSALDLEKFPLDSEVFLEPGTKLNPSKDTPSYLKTIDSGSCIILEDSSAFKKIEFKGDSFTGLWTFKKEEEPGSPFWEISRSTLPLEKNEFWTEIFKIDSEKQLVYGIVLKPEEYDSQNEIIGEDVIFDSMEDFMLHSQEFEEMHLSDIAKSKTKVIENYIAPADFMLNGRIVTKGSWVIGVKVLDAFLWKKIKSGEYKGFSVYGMAVKEIESPRI